MRERNRKNIVKVSMKIRLYTLIFTKNYIQYLGDITFSRQRTITSYIHTILNYSIYYLGHAVVSLSLQSCYFTMSPSVSVISQETFSTNKRNCCSHTSVLIISLNFKVHKH